MFSCLCFIFCISWSIAAMTVCSVSLCAVLLVTSDSQTDVRQSQWDSADLNNYDHQMIRPGLLTIIINNYQRTCRLHKHHLIRYLVIGSRTRLQDSQMWFLNIFVSVSGVIWIRGVISSSGWLVASVMSSVSSAPLNLEKLWLLLAAVLTWVRWPITAKLLYSSDQSQLSIIIIWPITSQYCSSVTNESTPLYVTGQWRRNSVLSMVRETDSDTWRLPVELTHDQTHEYRYCVIVSLQQQFPAERRKIIVRRWETHLIPRWVNID